MFIIYIIFFFNPRDNQVCFNHCDKYSQSTKSVPVQFCHHHFTGLYTFHTRFEQISKRVTDNNCNNNLIPMNMSIYIIEIYV